jgi:hypothetical protein
LRLQKPAQNRVHEIARTICEAGARVCLSARGSIVGCMRSLRRFTSVRVGFNYLVRLTKPLLYH